MVFSAIFKIGTVRSRTKDRHAIGARHKMIASKLLFIRYLKIDWKIIERNNSKSVRMENTFIRIN